MNLPLQIGAHERFDALRRALQELPYTEESICKRAGFSTIFDFTAHGRPKRTELNDGLDALMRVLMEGDSVTGDQMRALVPAELVAALEELGIVIRMGSDGDYFATVQLYPVESLYIVSDRTTPIEPARMDDYSDVVFSAISWNTEQFLACLPRSRCETLLDVCSGSGVAALACARAAGHVWSCDLAGRSVRFAEFNRRLNGIENVTCMQGDLYGAVADSTFDRIVAHPPYVPAAERQVLFRDGGDDGEQVLRGIIEGLPRHLRSGGQFYAFTMATDRQTDTLESRIRMWLGEREKEFDVLLVLTDLSRRQYYEKLADRLKITAAYFAAVVITHLETPRAAVTARTRKSAEAGRDAIEWFTAWKQASAAPGFDESLLEARPHMAPRFRLLVTHSVEGRALVASQFELRNEYPFSVVAPCPPWAAMMVSAYDGSRTAREVLAELKKQRVLAAEMTEAAFVADLKEMIARGFLELDEFLLPQRS